MNGIHDMGGMDGFGRVEVEENEPVFHEPWEGRVFALFWGGLRKWYRGRRISGGRFFLESIPPEDYLRMSYYERWFELIKHRLLNFDLVSEGELESGYRDPERPLPTPLSVTHSDPEEIADPDPAFKVDDQVRVRNFHPRGHTRCPRYARGKQGVVVTDNGIWNLQDTDEHGFRLGRIPQHVYTVRFRSQELWGDRASPNDSVYLDLWEEYIEPA